MLEPSVVALVPAAGRSRRMGQPKLLLPLDDTTVLGATARTLVDGGAERLWIVTPPDDELIAWGLTRGYSVALNPEPDRGMLSSIQEGLAALVSLGVTPDVVLVCPGDLPLLRAPSVRAVLAARAASGAPLAVPIRGERRGHPLAIAAELLPEVAQLSPEVGLRELRLRHAEATIEVPVDDPGILRDVDTPDEYRELTAP